MLACPQCARSLARVEDCLGPARFLLLVAAAAAAGGLLHTLAGPAAGRPAVGAGAVVAALLTFYGLEFPHARLGIWLWFLPLPRWLRFSALTSFWLWAALLALGDRLGGGVARGLSPWTLAGGVAAGLGGWLAFRAGRTLRPQ